MTGMALRPSALALGGMQSVVESDTPVVCRASWGYYRRLIRENFASHKDETEPERVQLMFDTAIRDADWVVAKVSALSTCWL